MPFLTVDATIGNRAFSHDECNIFPGLSYNLGNSTFLNSVRKNDAEAQVEFTLKVWKGLGSPVNDVTVNKDTLLVYVLYGFGILAGRCGSVVVREKDSGSRSRFDPGLRLSFF